METSMGFKKTTSSLDSSDFALTNCQEQNRSINLMEQLSAIISWSRVDSLLPSHYIVGTNVTLFIPIDNSGR
jgi:hypothetical protein